MAGGNHNTAVKILGTHHIGYAGSRGDMKQVCVSAGSRKTGYQRVLKHIAASSCVLADYNPATAIWIGL